MHLDNYSVTIREGIETGGGYVKIQHGKQYTIRLNNRRSGRCDAQVTVDGKEVGTFRLSSHGSITLERPPDSDGRFTFYKIGSVEANKASLGKVSRDDLGLIQVTFTPEKSSSVAVASAGPVGSPGEPSGRRVTYDAGVGKSAGGTGLSGHSDQSFYSVGPLDLDYSQAVTITLRLVSDEDVSPLEPARMGRSTPVPPPVD